MKEVHVYETSNKMNKLLWTSLLSILQLWMICPLTVCKANEDDAGAILVLGDSWASASGTFLGGVCSLVINEDEREGGYTTKAVANHGIAGSTAAGWASSGKAKDAFTNPKYDYRYVWLSIGGNDFLGSCDDNGSISQNILSVISDVIDSSSNEKLEILYTGYGYPTKDGCGGGTGPYDALNLSIRNAIENSSYAGRVTYVDISSEFVTAQSYPFSDKQWYADNIHINEAGYIKLYSIEAIQDFFECASTARTTSSPSSSHTTTPTTSIPTTTPTRKTSTPTSSTLTPVPTSICKDRTESFTATKPGENGWVKQKTCQDWVNRKWTAWRCKFVGEVKESCPKMCTNCCVDTEDSFVLRGNGKLKTCKWAAANASVRCRKAPTRQLCAVTCAECD